MVVVLVIGSGGREHALCWKLAQSRHVDTIFVAPGNYGISLTEKVKLVTVDIKDYKKVAKWCKDQHVDLVVVGPEDPLAGGIADVMAEHSIACFGPSKLSARIEADKNWAKAFMDRHNIPTAWWSSFTNAAEAKKYILTASFPALVVKASGLAAGKGVVVAATKEDACQAVDSILTEKHFGDAGATVVVEELLEGQEVSVLAFSDGTSVKVMLPTQDHKRLLNGDRGPNTGGMGAYCPCPLLSDKQLEYVTQCVLQQAVDGLRAEGMPFIGVLYAGLMMTAAGPKVLEFNCRFGDPETQVLLPLLESDLLEVMQACVKGSLAAVQLLWKPATCTAGVVMASRGYPESSSKGDVISGLNLAQGPQMLVFHSGTALRDGAVVTNGGRVLITVALGSNLVEATARAIRTCRTISFTGAQFRTDIAFKGIAKTILRVGQLTYKDSGVDIEAGDSLVEQIKPHVASTTRSGVMGTIGGFGGLFDLRATNYKDPLLVSGTDGVGTKLMVAEAVGNHSTIGIDLVAMCVNDILAHGAEPLFFLDYFACGHLDVGVASAVVKGIAEGCCQAGCALVGGETAEMPGLYAQGDYDLAGFAVGAVERSQLIPRIDIVEGDILVGLPSSGLHSNGYSLARRVLECAGVGWTDPLPWDKSLSFGEALLTPTRIYVKSVLPALRSGCIKALAHITGGGLVGNVPRVLPSGLGARLDASSWSLPQLLGWFATEGNISQAELLRTFNCGLGLVLVVGAAQHKQALQLLGADARTVGKVVLCPPGRDVVEVVGFEPAMEAAMSPFVPRVVASHSAPLKRIGVLISGSGTNLQSLIDATLDRSRGTGSEIVLVISNKLSAQGLKRAERVGIPTKVIKHGDFASRLDFDMAVHKALTEVGVELLCLAGFMRVLTPEFVRLWRGRLLNIHPALLPSFKGVHAHQQALDAGVRMTGCTAHFVDEGVDTGAIIAQEAVPVEVGDTEETLQERVKLAEHRIFPHALTLVATEQVRLGDDGKLQWLRTHQSAGH